MNFIVITSTPNSINVDFGAYSNASVPNGIVPKKRCIPKSQMVFTLIPDKSMIEAQTLYNALTFPVSFDLTQTTFKVTSVDGVTPTDNDHLYDLLIALIS